MMDFYFGVDMLLHLKKHYEARLSLAISRGFDQQSDRYHWLFRELQYRVTTLRRVLAVLDVLPDFMCKQSEDQIFAMVVGDITPWFSEENLGAMPHDKDGSCVYFHESNPYWIDYQTAMDRFHMGYDYSCLTTFYIDLVEYYVMAVRLYFYIREKQFKSIDRGKYDDLVGVRAVLPAPA